jgi:hypothetical protein
MNPLRFYGQLYLGNGFLGQIPLLIAKKVPVLHSFGSSLLLSTIIFPSVKLSFEPGTRNLRCHHIDESGVNPSQYRRTAHLPEQSLGSSLE